MEKRTRRRFFRAEARRLLGEQSNLFTLIMASLTLAMMTIAWQVIVDGFFAFFDFGILAPEPPLDEAVGGARTAIGSLGTVLLLMPLWYGMRAIGMTAVNGQGSDTRAEVGQLFTAFSSLRTLWRVWRASILVVWRFALSAGLIWGMWYGVALLGAVLNPVLYLSLCAMAVVLTPILLLPLAGTHLLFPLMLAEPQIGAFRALRTATRIALRSLGETLCFWGSFLGWFALAFATGGVMLVLYVLPYFILADTEYALYLMARNGRPITISTKEINYVQ